MTKLGTLIIIRGIPGSGKTTFAKELLDKSVQPSVHIEADMYRQPTPACKYIYDKACDKEALMWSYLEAKRYLQQGYTVILSNTAPTVYSIKAIVEYTKHSPSIIYRMTGEYKNTHNVPKDVVQSFKEVFEDVIGEIKK